MQSNEYKPPRVFRVITSASVQGDEQFLDYLVTTEQSRRMSLGEPPLVGQELLNYRRQLAREQTIRGDVESAIATKSTPSQILMEKKSK
jgi:hypothetical protein